MVGLSVFQFSGWTGYGENLAPPRRRRDAVGTSGGGGEDAPLRAGVLPTGPNRGLPMTPPLGYPAPPPARAGKCVRIHTGRHKGHIDPGDSTTVWNTLLNGHAEFAALCPEYSRTGRFRCAFSTSENSQYTTFQVA